MSEVNSKAETVTSDYEVLDECDQASLFADKMNDDGVRAVLARMPKGRSLEECVDCGEDIPEQRQKAFPGVIRCIDCQTQHERVR